MGVRIQLGEVDITLKEEELRARLWKLLLARGKAPSLAVFDGVLHPVGVDPDWVIVAARTVRELVPEAVVLRGWLTEGVLRYDLRPPRTSTSTADIYARVARLILVAVNGEVSIVDGLDGLCSRLAQLDPCKVWRVTAEKDERVLSRLVVGPEAVEKFIADFSAGYVEKTPGISNAMRAAMVAPLQTKILEGYSPRVVDSNRGTLIRDGLEHEIQRVTRWMSSSKDEDGELKARLVTAEKALDFILKKGLPGDVAAYLPTCGSAVARST